MAGEPKRFRDRIGFCRSLNFLGLGLKCCTVPKKPKKPIQNLQAGEALKVLENRFFRFLGTVQHFSMKKPKKLGTVQHFCNPEEQKCCTVPKFLVPKYKNLGTVQHFYPTGP